VPEDLLGGLRVHTEFDQVPRARLAQGAKRETAVQPATNAPVAETRSVRRPRTADDAIDAESMIRQLVGKLRQHGSAEVEQMRAAVRKAIAVLQAAIA
jgi:hypothetical protein